MSRETDIALELFWHFALLSMMAIGGGVLALTPEMLRFVSETNRWISAETFVECFTLAQVAPGPNFLFATLVGMQVAGLTGAVAATAALIVPPSALAILTLHFGTKLKMGPWGSVVRTSILPLSIGMVASTAWSLGMMTVHTGPQLAAFALSLMVMLKTKLNPLWLIAAGALAGSLGLI